MEKRELHVSVSRQNGSIEKVPVINTMVEILNGKE